MSSERLSHKDIGHTELYLRSDGIVEVVASDHLYSTEDIQAIHAAVAQMTENKRTLLLLIASDYTSIDHGARQFLGTTEAGNHSIAEAYVIRSLAQRLIMNFITRVMGTPVPVHFFTEITEATRWLKMHLPSTFPGESHTT